MRSGDSSLTCSHRAARRLQIGRGVRWCRGMLPPLPDDFHAGAGSAECRGGREQRIEMNGPGQRVEIEETSRFHKERHMEIFLDGKDGIAHDRFQAWRREHK